MANDRTTKSPPPMPPGPSTDDRRRTLVKFLSERGIPFIERPPGTLAVGQWTFDCDSGTFRDDEAMFAGSGIAAFMALLEKSIPTRPIPKPFRFGSDVSHLTLDHNEVSPPFTKPGLLVINNPPTNCS